MPLIWLTREKRKLAAEGPERSRRVRSEQYTVKSEHEGELPTAYCLLPTGEAKRRKGILTLGDE